MRHPAPTQASSPHARRAAERADDDEVVLRVPVTLRKADEGAPLCLFQYPLRPQWRPYNLDEITSARVRPEQRRVEFTLGMECHPSHHDEDSLSPLSTIQLASKSTSMHPTSYAIAMLRTDDQGVPIGLSLTPLSSTIQMRPSFSQLDQVDSSGDGSAKATPSRPGSSTSAMQTDGMESGAAEDDEGEDNAEVGEEDIMPMATPLFRPAQTEREIEARRSSHAFLVEEREKEPWSNANVYSPSSSESIAVRRRYFGT